jgi:hypothetical protein
VCIGGSSTSGTNWNPVDVPEESLPKNSHESTLRKEVHQLKRLLAEKTLEADFFKGALQKIEARRPAAVRGCVPAPDFSPAIG